MAPKYTCVFTTTHIHAQFTVTFDPLKISTLLKEEKGSNLVNFPLLFSFSIRFLVVTVIMHGLLNPSVFLFTPLPLFLFRQASVCILTALIPNRLNVSNAVVVNTSQAGLKRCAVFSRSSVTQVSPRSSNKDFSCGTAIPLRYKLCKCVTW